MTESELEQQFTAAMERLFSRDKRVQMEFPLIGIVSIVALVQLSLRHPDLPPRTRQAGERFVETSIGMFDWVEPVVAEVLRRGNDHSKDVMVPTTS